MPSITSALPLSSELSASFCSCPPKNRGGFDDRSDRRQPLGELIARGYEDAYHQFIEPIVGGSGERVGQG